MDLSIVVLTFNAKDITLKMFSSLKKSLDYVDEKSSGRIKWEVIAVDNGSTDGVADKIEKRHSSWLKLVRNTNVGFAKGNNLGVKHSDKSSEYVLFLNPDILLDKKVIFDMYNFMKANPDVGISSCRVDLWSGGLDLDSHRGFPSPWPAFCYFTGLETLLGYRFPKVFGKYHLLEKDFNQTHEIDVCLGAFMMIPRKIGEKTSWWPEDYFLNGEDVDICYQVKIIHGYKVMYVPYTGVVHYKGASKGTKNNNKADFNIPEETKQVQINSGIRSMKIFYDKYFKRKYPFWVTRFVYMGMWILKKRRLLSKKEGGFF